MRSDDDEDTSSIVAVTEGYLRELNWNHAIVEFEDMDGEVQAVSWELDYTELRGVWAAGAVCTLAHHDDGRIELLWHTDSMGSDYVAVSMAPD